MEQRVKQIRAEPDCNEQANECFGHVRLLEPVALARIERGVLTMIDVVPKVTQMTNDHLNKLTEAVNGFGQRLTRIEQQLDRINGKPPVRLVTK